LTLHNTTCSVLSAKNNHRYDISYPTKCLLIDLSLLLNLHQFLISISAIEIRDININGEIGKLFPVHGFKVLLK
jgi:hypothetical protein